MPTELEPATPEAATVAAAQRGLTGRLKRAGIVPSASEARALLMHVLGLDWSGLILAGERPLTPDEQAALEALTVRRERREPLQHLLGELEWGGLRLLVTPAALIPRPETERLLELALALLPQHTGLAVLDVGTGSGALALGLKAARPDLAVSASDVSRAALALARANAVRLGLTITLRHADLLVGVPGTFDLIVSNPPYLPDADRLSAPSELAYDPAGALYGGPDGLTLARTLLRQAPARLRPGGAALLELDPRNVETLAAELRTAGWQAEVLPDLSGRQRFLRARPGGGERAR